MSEARWVRKGLLVMLAAMWITVGVSMIAATPVAASGCPQGWCDGDADCDQCTCMKNAGFCVYDS